MSHKPLIVVSNDDGYQATGLLVLADALEEVAEVVVVAPERERSAVSHSISLHKPLRLEQWGERRWWSSGTPTDCVYLAVVHLLDRPPDLVVSGINRGPNLAEDVLYSGTVAAAMEACIMDLPALAVSLALDESGSGKIDPDPAPAARLARQVVTDALERGIPHRTLLNLNVPSGYRDGDGWEVTRMGRRNYLREVRVNEDPRGRRYYWIGGPRIGWHDVPGSDCNAIRDGRASLTPIHLDLTHHHLMDELTAWPSSDPS
ncbi:MAG: 5'/3'-nucleotidase SurE [Deltaproteobacteria bacterium]|nr:MAG: 5'/3'-nucleotidase SurE [Deltaproteobacteria bacterium]